MKWFLKCLRNYFVFKGRASRTEYWMFYLISTILLYSIGILWIICERLFGGFFNDLFGGILILSIIGILIPSFSVAVRRFHDTGKSGWWIWVVLIPTIGAICALCILITKGDKGDNKYGSDPKG
ncbi:Inner membrane protein YhaH [termite gut metagenome]|uniref:Inner membrane protein YhaH n=1 Tax=termite gut metagenome TaxID=433724 RepID=A0A5J4T2S6_9ZZZZ